MSSRAASPCPYSPFPPTPSLSQAEAMRYGQTNLNAPVAPAGYKFAGWAPPPDGRLHDGRSPFFPFHVTPYPSFPSSHPLMSPIPPTSSASSPPKKTMPSLGQCRPIPRCYVYAVHRPRGFAWMIRGLDVTYMPCAPLPPGCYVPCAAYLDVTCVPRVALF